MKKHISLIMIAVMILSTFSASTLAASSKYFSDVTNRDYFKNAAESLYDAGIVKGYDDNTFGPDNSVTRAEMVTFVCRAMNKEEDAQIMNGRTTAFSMDVPSEHWASGYVSYAVYTGIVSGDGNGLFRPQDPVKYEEAVKMIVCAIGLKNSVVQYPDDWAKGYIEAADKHGFTKNNVKEKRGEYINRADVAVLLWGAIEDKLYSLTVNNAWEGEGNFDELKKYYFEGDIIPVNFTPPKGYSFVRWSTDGAGQFDIPQLANTYFLMPAEDVVISPICKKSSTSDDSNTNTNTNTSTNTKYDDDDSNNSQSSSSNEEKTWSDYMANPDNFYNVYEDDDYDPENPGGKDDYDNNRYQLTVKMVGCGGIRNTSGKYGSGDGVPIYVYPGTEKDFLMWISTGGRVIWPDDPTSIIAMPNEDVEVCAVFREADGSIPNIPGFKEKYNKFIKGLDSSKDDYEEDEEDNNSYYEEDDEDEDFEDYIYSKEIDFIRLENEVINLVNEERAKEGLGKLYKDDALALRKAAVAHSKDMHLRNFFDHTNPDGESPFDRMKKYGASFRTAGENIAKGQKTAKAVVDAWMNSPGHRANILNPDFKYIGVGVIEYNGTYIWTQCFSG